MDEGTRSTIKTAALQTLKRGPMTREQLAREAKVDLGSMVVVLGDLLKEGLVKVEAQGRLAVWRLVETD